jgi:DNA-binding response OmpR family regulator
MDILQKRILCVEDDELGAELLTYHLSDYEMIVVTTQSEGLKIARGGEFHLYLIGNSLGDGSGIELCRLIRTFDPTTPIIVLSGDARDMVRGRALGAGAQDFIIKPIDYNYLTRIVTILIKA